MINIQKDLADYEDAHSRGCLIDALFMLYMLRDYI
jgi:hypothetical protein